MNEYKEWLESKIDEMNNLIERSIKAECYDVVYTLVTKVEIYKECLVEFEKENEQDETVSFSDLEVGKRYVGVHINGGKTNVFAIIGKGCDDEGQYIWYGDTMKDTISFKSYANEYETVEYFEEIE